MAFSSSDENKKLFTEINITPLTDIFLVLLIIMMVVAPLLDQQGLNLTVPSRVEADKIQQESKVLSVVVDDDDTYYLDNEQIDISDLGKFLKENIFEPLKMEDTAFYVPAEKQNRISKIYHSLPDEKLEEFTGCNLGVGYKMDRPPAFESGGAGICSTADDFMKFGLMLMNKGSYDNGKILESVIEL